MEFIDTHCHIQSAGAEHGEKNTRDLWAKTNLGSNDIIKNAEAAGVTGLICVGCDLADSRLAVDFANAHEDCWASIGIHPHEASRYAGDTEKLAEFTSLAASQKVVAIGECGLDYFYDHSPKETQFEILKFQIKLAQKNNLPIIFHVREAFDDFWPIFESFNGKQKTRGVLHSFTDSRANLERALDHGLFIGVNGIATFTKNPKQLEVYRAVPLDKLLLETDAPFLTPVPYRGTINEPKYVRVVAEYLADLRGESLEALATATTTNGKELFGI